MYRFEPGYSLILSVNFEILQAWLPIWAFHLIMRDKIFNFSKPQFPYL